MISLRQLLIVVLVGVAVWLFKRLQQRFMEQRFATPEQAKSPKSNQYHDMVRCERCGAHIARAQAQGNPRNGYYCADVNCLDQETRAGRS